MSASPTGYPANPALRIHSHYRHFERERVRWSDTDQIGHVNNLAFAAYCETGRSMFMNQVTMQNRALGRLFVVSQLVVNFIEELHWPAEVMVGTGVMQIGRTSYRVGQGLFANDRCFGTAESLLVQIDAESRRPTPISDELRAWLETYRIA
ncbi:acyl-CoA thioesterase [Nevskia sp.]|uniref:acyl-CoA thioesterase n=1 Tax=Nevskia sp. TaxID=1929292 RepID=UPI003F7153C4